MALRLLLPLATILLILPSAQGQCGGAKTCSECIRVSPDCRWCEDKDLAVEYERCNSRNDFTVTSCKTWADPKKEVDSKNEPFNDRVQVRPSSLDIKMRPGDDHTQTITVKAAKNYPLDLYYLMDFSYSMNDDLEQLKTSTARIAESLKNVSTNFALGFGTFVDKPIAPYASTEDNKLDEPCAGCSPVHSFNHVMDITSGNNAQTELTQKLNALNISSNIDNPEGGMDALVQATVCKDIGWRTDSRRVIFYASDAIFHMAGDGALAGIVTPNSGTCGLSNGKYTRSLEEDYPSIGQINSVLIKNKVIPIFAVPRKMNNLYTDLSNQLSQLSQVGSLDDKSETVADIIRKQLNSIVSWTQLNPQAPPNVKVSIVPKCSNGQELAGNGCKGVNVGDEVVFDVKFRVDECISSDSDNTYSFDIDVPGIATIPVKISLICQCECSTDKSDIQINPDTCHGRGDLICGSCQCKDNTYGSHCQCDQTTATNVTRCTDPDSGRVCNGGNNGMCICGQCECIPPTKKEYKRWGKYCECSNFDCPRNSEYAICSNNGYCNCGTCECNKTVGGAPQEVKFTGIDCGCPISNETCRSQDSDVLCSGNGECVCGECNCKKDYYGKHCDICQECGPLDCSKYPECVKCVYLEEGDWRKCGCNVSTVLSADERVDTSKLGRHKQCTSIDDPTNDGCSIIYYLHYEDKGISQQPNLISIHIDREPDCPSAPNIIAIVAGVIGGIVGVGVLLLIIWKIITGIVDKREYEKFLEERSKAKWNSEISPIYSDPITEYKNPLYKGASGNTFPAGSSPSPDSGLYSDSPMVSNDYVYSDPDLELDCGGVVIKFDPINGAGVVIKNEGAEAERAI